MWIVSSSTSVSPWSASALSDRSASIRCIWVALAGLMALPNGRDFTTSPARTET